MVRQRNLALFYWDVFKMLWNDRTRLGYSNLFAKMVINPGHLQEIDRICSIALANKSKYEIVSRSTGVPWEVIAAIHRMESGADFRTHLHNGDPLSSRTRHVPAGRPFSGSPPYDWTFSAIDALKYEGFDKVTDWSIPHCLYLMEKYNGFGYTSKNVNSPYLWSYSNLYSRGLFIADGQYSSSAASKQCGAAVILKALIDKGISTNFISKKESPMSLDLEPILSLARVFAPGVATALTGPVGGAITTMLAAELKVDPTALPQAPTSHPAATLIAALQKIESVLTPSTIQSVEAISEPESPPTKATIPEKPPTASVLVDVNATTGQHLAAGFLFILASFFIKDAAAADSIANALAPAVWAIGSGLAGGALTWFMRSALGASNAATVEKYLHR
jgi:lysozyme family protein